MALALVFNIVAFWMVGIALYFGLWAYFVVMMFRTSHCHDGITDIRRVGLYNYFATVTRHYGWIGVLLFVGVCSWIFPEIKIVEEKPMTSKPKVISGNRYWDDEGNWQYPEDEPIVEKFFVPFYFKGRFCSPFRTYIYNDLPDTLMLYKTEFFGGKYTRVSGKRVILPSEMTPFSHHIFYYFRTPQQSGRRDILLTGEDLKRDQSWTLNTKANAEESIVYINQCIARGYLPDLPNFEVRKPNLYFTVDTPYKVPIKTKR